MAGNSILISAFRAGRYVKQRGYRCFVPSLVNHDWVTDDPGLVGALMQAQARLAELNTMGSLMPEIGFLARMNMAKEATQSSRIEGTRTNLEEAVLEIEKIDAEKRDDWQEVQNYIQAMEFAISGLNKLPLSGRLIKQTHAILLQGVRGRHKLPGQYRQSQNWVGGARLADAVFIPPAPEYLTDLLSDLDELMNNDDLTVSPIIRAGIIHYQFETIHPFLDGNGRMGRLLIILYLISSGLLTTSTLYISDYFEKHRAIYFDQLTAVREKNQLNRWLLFFVNGINETAEKSIQTIKRAVVLKQEIENNRFPQMGRRSKTAQQLLSILFTKPVITTEEVAEKLNIGIATAYRLVTEFEKTGILTNKTGYRRNRIFVFNEYLELFD